MLDLELMSDQEIKWLNDYHAEVWSKVCLAFAYFRLHFTCQTLYSPHRSRSPNLGMRFLSTSLSNFTCRYF